MGTNGLLSFGDAYNTWFNQQFPLTSRYLVAPFWDDVDIRGGNGQISYEVYNSGYFLDHISAFIRQQRPSMFQGTWMVVAYWDAVHPYLGTLNPEVNIYVYEYYPHLPIACKLCSRKTPSKQYSSLMAHTPIRSSPTSVVYWSGAVVSPLGTMLQERATTTMIHPLQRLLA